MCPGYSGPVEAVFSLGGVSVPDLPSGSGTKLFQYLNGPVKVPGPWKRGRPKGTQRKPKGATNTTPADYRFINLTPGKNSVIVHKDISRALTKNKQRTGNASNLSEHRGIEQFKPNFYQIQGVDPFGQTPIDLEPYMLDLLRFYVDTAWKNFYTLEVLAGCNPVSEFWIPRAFQDSALIHTFVGCAVAYAYGYHAIAFQGRGLRHLQDAISVVKRRLGSPGANFSSTTLAVIAGIAMLEKGAGNHRHWEIHMHGLRDLVGRRGGEQALASEPLILQKMYRADLVGSLDTGHRSWFMGPSTHQFCVQPTAPVRSEGFKALFEMVALCPPLQNCVRELEAYVACWPVFDTDSSLYGLKGGATIIPDSSNAESKNPGAKLTATQAKNMRDVLIEVQYALVSDEVLKHCHQETHYGRVNNFCRIALIMYSLTVLHEPSPSYMLSRQIGVIFRRVYNDIIQSPSTPLFTDETILEPLRWSLPIGFFLWAFFLAATTTEGTEGETSQWFRAMFAHLASKEFVNKSLGGADSVGRLAALKVRLQQYLWVPCIHDESLGRL